MNKTILLIPLFILALTFVNATTLELQSDSTTEYYTGSNWQPAVAVADTTAWDSYVSIPATWIWTTESTNLASSEQFRKVFDLPCSNVQNSVLTITADNEYTVMLNGAPIAADNSDGNWYDVETYNIPTDLFKKGENVLTIDAQNYEGESFNPAGLIYTLTTNYRCSAHHDEDTITNPDDSSTPAIVEGTVTYEDGSVVAGAKVDVLCNGVLLTTDTNIEGNYFVTFTSIECDYGSSVSVTATKDDVTGENTGNTCATSEDCEIPVALVDVTIPEFGVIGGAIVLLAGLGIIVYRRK